MPTMITPEEIADLALIPPTINTAPLPDYGYDQLDYGMTIGIERTASERLWASWVGGGDNEKAYFVLATSDTAGRTWSPPKVVIDPHDNENIPLERRSLVGNLWLDPLDRLWLFFDQAVSYFDGRSGVWAIRCDNPEAERPQWTTPRRIWHGSSLNKPIVLSTGEWLLNVSLWNRERITPTFKNAFHELDPYRRLNILISRDQGETWQLQGGVRFPEPEFDEGHIVERRNGMLWLTARTHTGIWESLSHDRGATWSEPTPSPIGNVSARHHLRRLQSGRLLLVKHGSKLEEHSKNEKGQPVRSQLTAFLSSDHGETWQGGLVIDEREGVSYPDGLQLDDETIIVSYDYQRDKLGHILFARFQEDDVLAGRLISEGAALKQLISKPNPQAVEQRLALEKKD